MIIIEGMDNTGKSTLAKKLSLKFNLKIIKSSGPPEDKESWIKKIHYSIDQSKKGINFIYDRHPLISEYVYGPILRGKNLLDNEEGNQLWKEFIEIQPFIIYCRPPIFCIIKYGERKQMNGVIKNTNLLVRAYDSFIAEVSKSMEVFHYNYLENTEYKIFIKIRYYLNWKVEPRDE